MDGNVPPVPSIPIMEQKQIPNPINANIKTSIIIMTLALSIIAIAACYTFMPMPFSIHVSVGIFFLCVPLITVLFKLVNRFDPPMPLENQSVKNETRNKDQQASTQMRTFIPNVLPAYV